MTRSSTRFFQALAGAIVASGLVACGGGGGGSSNWSPDADTFDDSSSGAMVSIPGGTAKVGIKHPTIAATIKKSKKAKSQFRSKSIEGFSIDKYEVTSHNYYEFLQTLDEEKRDEWRPRHHIKTAKHPAWYSKSARYKKGKGDFPVSGIPIDAAEAYAQWRGKRLPDEFEWEYAARGKAGNYYPTGDTFQPSKAVVGANENVTTMVAVNDALNEADKSEFGVVGLGGNVSEWCATSETRLFDNAGEDGKVSKEKSRLKIYAFRGPNFESMRDLECLLSYQGYVSPRSKDRESKYHVARGFRCAK